MSGKLTADSLRVRVTVRAQAIALTTVLLHATVIAQNVPDAKQDALEWFRHIRTSDPSRPTGPLRQDNVTDEEVSEIQRSALEAYPDAIVSISGVTRGCGCEEGSKCTEQVWLALNRDASTWSLVLSKIDKHWKVGAVQSWWLRYSAHQRANPQLFVRNPRQAAWEEENQQLLNKFPACPLAPANWMLLRNEKFQSVSIDTSSIRGSGPIRRANFKFAYLPRPKKLPWGSTYFHIESIAIDCKQDREQTEWIDHYLDDGTAYETSGYSDPVLWSPIRPNTDSAADRDLVCGWSEQKSVESHK